VIRAYRIKGPACLSCLVETLTGFRATAIGGKKRSKRASGGSKKSASKKSNKKKASKKKASEEKASKKKGGKKRKFSKKQLAAQAKFKRMVKSGKMQKLAAAGRRKKKGKK